MKDNNFNDAFETLFSPLVEKMVTRVLHEQKETKVPVKEPEQFLTIGQAAKEFGCTTHLLQKAINNLELDYYKPENRTYIKRKDMYSYLESIKIPCRDNNDDCKF